MNLPKMIFQKLQPQDRFGLKIIANGCHDVIILEDKEMNSAVKEEYLDEFTEHSLI